MLVCATNRCHPSRRSPTTSPSTTSSPPTPRTAIFLKIMSTTNLEALEIGSVASSELSCGWYVLCSSLIRRCTTTLRMRPSRTSPSSTQPRWLLKPTTPVCLDVRFDPQALTTLVSWSATPSLLPIRTQVCCWVHRHFSGDDKYKDVVFQASRSLAYGFLLLVFTVQFPLQQDCWLHPQLGQQDQQQLPGHHR